MRSIFKVCLIFPQCSSYFWPEKLAVFQEQWIFDSKEGSNRLYEGERSRCLVLIFHQLNQC